MDLGYKRLVLSAIECNGTICEPKKWGIMCPNQINASILVHNMLVKSKHLNTRNDCHNACVSKVTAQTSGKMGATACEDGLGGGSKI